MHVTNHAVLRYQERVERIPARDIRAIIQRSETVIEKAAEIGCDTVILGNGVRLKLAGNVVATVLEKRGHR